MATVVKEIHTRASADAAWDAIRDVGALHVRLVPGFVVDTALVEGGAVRVVTFANGLVAHEPIVALDDSRRRLAWTARGGHTTHYHASAQVFAEGTGARVVWIADFLPHGAVTAIEGAMAAGAAAMEAALDGR